MPRLLDLFCGAGGCSMGYHRSGFDVVGVDIKPMPHYPFEFHQADARQYVAEHGREFDAIHASPPCQGYHHLRGHNYDLLIPEVRSLLEQTGKPYVIENIPAAGWDMRNPIVLCGTMFDPIIGVRRHRLFESNWNLQHPVWPCRHQLLTRSVDVYEHGQWRKRRFVPVYGMGGGKSAEQAPTAMGIDWMSRSELVEAIPPLYTEFIGTQLLLALGKAA